MGKILTGDRAELDWPYNCGPITSLTSDKLKALMSKDAATRCIASADVQTIHARQLYRTSSRLNSFMKERAIGRKIIALRLESFVAGSSLNVLQNVIGKETRLEALEALMKAQSF